MNVLAFFLSPLGRKVALGLVFLAAIGGIYLKGHSDGASAVQGKWDAAVQAAIERGEKARTDAESSVGADTADGVRNDKFNRNKGAM